MYIYEICAGSNMNALPSGQFYPSFIAVNQGIDPWLNARFILNNEGRVLILDVTHAGPVSFPLFECSVVVEYALAAVAYTKGGGKRLLASSSFIIYAYYKSNEKQQWQWRIRNNRKIDELSGGQDIVRFVKSQRLRWLGHLYRMPETRVPRRMLEGRIHHRRRIGRPKLRWLDGE
ncbi:hypothetical protein C0J52_27054 [Blattella germanica]|nr:hypothetical protein C0J52_27054 [Blattella germanica]